LIETFGSHFGFLADEILEIIVIDSLLVEYSLDFIPYHRDGFIRGKLVMNDRKILFFDFEKVSKDLDELEILSVSELPEKVLQGH
jgi:chemotaxis signal transduction protein